MNKIFLTTLGVLALLGSGCAETRTIKQPVEQVSEVHPNQNKAIPEAEFVDGLMKSDASWHEYTDQAIGITFQYPQGFFTETQRKGDQDSGMSYQLFAKPTVPEDGICDGLGDVDCDIALWPKRYANFNAALQGAEYRYGAYESIPLAQDVQIIQGMKFVKVISQGINGSCALSYFRATPSSYASFHINLCDDPQLDIEKWFGSTIAEDERLKAKNILANKDLSDSTRVKIEAMEKVLATLKMK